MKKSVFQLSGQNAVGRNTEKRFYNLVCICKLYFGEMTDIFPQFPR